MEETDTVRSSASPEERAFLETHLSYKLVTASLLPRTLRLTPNVKSKKQQHALIQQNQQLPFSEEIPGILTALCVSVLGGVW